MFEPWKKHQKRGHDVVRCRDIGMHYIQCNDCGKRWHIGGPLARRR